MECWLPAGRGRVNEKLQSQLNSPELDFPSQRQALMRWLLKPFLALPLTISWNLVTDLILPISTCVLHHPTAKLINYFTACKEQPLTVTGPQPKWKKEKEKIQPYSLCIASIFTEEYYASDTTLARRPPISSAVDPGHTPQLWFYFSQMDQTCLERSCEENNLQVLLLPSNYADIFISEFKELLLFQKPAHFPHKVL